MSEKIKMEYADHFGDVMEVMSKRGVLLATCEKDGGKANAMTIGWGMWQYMVKAYLAGDGAAVEVYVSAVGGAATL